MCFKSSIVVVVVLLYNQQLFPKPQIWFCCENKYEYLLNIKTVLYKRNTNNGSNYSKQPKNLKYQIFRVEGYKCNEQSKIL